MSRSARRGFTLVELLVVIAIIGVLIAISLPSFQGLRESSRRMECQVRLARIGEALMNYESAYGALPAGTINPSGPIHTRPTGTHTSWIAQILPYLGEPSAQAHVDLGRSVYGAQNEAVRRFHLTGVMCPSDPSDTNAWPASSYAGCHHDIEAPIAADNRGLLFLNSHVRFDQIADGRGYTLLLGEKQIDPADLGWMSGTRATLRNTGTPLYAGDTLQPLPAGTSDTFVGGFSSYHTGAVNVLLADGTTRALETTVDPQFFQRLGNRADGALLDWTTGH